MLRSVGKTEPETSSEHSISFGLNLDLGFATIWEATLLLNGDPKLVIHGLVVWFDQGHMHH